MDADEMDCFGSVHHQDDNSDVPLSQGPKTIEEMLDYMVLVIARCLPAAKAFKGGYMLSQIMAMESRMTHDVDFSIADKENYDQVKHILNQIGERFTEMGLVQRYMVKEDISPTRSGGMDMYDSAGVKILGVDVGLHSLSYGVTSYEFKIGTIEGFTIERMVADKLLAILSRKRFRRTKDLYDLYILTKYFDMDCQALTVCIENRSNYDPAVWDNIPFREDAIVQYAHAWDRLQLRSFQTQADLIKPAFEEAIQVLYSVALPLKYGQRTGRWDTEEKRWVNAPQQMGDR